MRFNSDGSGCSNYFNAAKNQFMLGSSVCPTYTLGNVFTAIGSQNILCSGQRDFILGLRNCSDHSSRWNLLIGIDNFISRGTSTISPFSEGSTLFGRLNGITQCGYDSSKNVRNAVMLGFCNNLSLGLAPLSGADAVTLIGYVNTACCVNSNVTLIGQQNTALKGCNIGIIGRLNVNSGCDSYAMGHSNTITSNGSVGLGFCSTNSGANSTFIGGCQLSSGSVWSNAGVLNIVP